MINVFLEIEKLKASLRTKGIEESSIELIALNAENQINLALREKLNSAIELAIESGVQKQSINFINEIRPRPDAFMLDTESGITDFSEPPMPMLDRLLASGAKPMKDGSGVYKVIPVGANNGNKKPIYANIFDTQKAIQAERYEKSVSQYNKIIPSNSKVNFRTATSKQNRQTQWVLPEKEKDFTEDLQSINSMLSQEHDEVILGIIKEHEEGF